MTSRFYILTLLALFCGLFSFAQNIEFVENKGQWNSEVRFTGAVSNGGFFIHNNGFTVLQYNKEDWARLKEYSHGHSEKSIKEDDAMRGHAWRVSFLGGGKETRLVADKPLPTYNNYFIGADPSRWASQCRIYTGITVQNIYPNIDLRYYSTNGTLKYDIIVHPGGRVSDIALRYEGLEGLRVKGKELVLSTSIGELKESAPYTYQFSDAGKKEIAARYSVKDATVRFDIKNYDATQPLIIDPTLEFCSFSGSTTDNWGYTATYGPDGSLFGGGIVNAVGFPVSPGAVQTAYRGGSWDVGIIKLSADGSTRLYATYLGGTGTEQPHSLISDPQGNLVITGRTNSNTGPQSNWYPVTGTGKIGSCQGYDIFVTKLNAAGTALIGSKLIGGALNDGVNIREAHEGGPQQLIRNYGDDGRGEVNLDAAGNIYVGSCTNSNDFPTPGGFQTAKAGQQDGVILKMTPDANNLLFASYLGGSNPNSQNPGNDAIYSVTIAPNGQIYVAGGTQSIDLPGNTVGTIGAGNQGTIDGFVSIITSDGSAILRTTYLGTGGIDQVYGLKFDRLGFPYVMGQTTGTWPVVNAPWSQSAGKQFIAKLQPDLSSYVYSTVFGKGSPTPDISPVAFLVDRCENVYVSGWGGNADFPNSGVQGLSVTPDAIKSTPDINSAGLGADFYFFVLQRNATAQLYGSFFGQNSNQFGDHVDGGTSRFDDNGVIYQAMCASCNTTSPFPTTAGVWAPTKPASANCNLAMVKLNFDLAGVTGGIRTEVDGRPRVTTGCLPLEVTFVDTVLNAQSYEWFFNDGSQPTPVRTTQPTITHTFVTEGTFNVMMVAIDSNSCNIRDTSYVAITVSNLLSTLDFNAVKLNPCDSFKYRFDNLSVAPPARPFGPATFTWDFGDGSPRVTTGSGPVFHNYVSPGTYNVRLILNDSVYCNFPDTLVKQLRVAVLVDADFSTPPLGCAPYDAVFANNSQGGQQFFWDFGDNQGTSTEINPTYTYALPGTYTITLIAVDSATCNISDTTQFTITVQGAPTADFSAAPQPPITNTPITFTNLSSPDAVRFKWLFGDGDSLITTSRAPIQHEYNASRTYNACLIAYNQAGCPDTVCRDVRVLVEPAVDVPNAFTPLKGGVNSVVMVRGYGIERMRFTIWARWGEKVFETNSRDIGWDGRYKGKLLPMDVYAYTLDVEFSDGTKTTKTGDITLIR